MARDFTRPPPAAAHGRKRKEPPAAAARGGGDKRPRVDYRSKQRDARQLCTQATSQAFRGGELDVDRFVRAREFEIQALDEGMRRSRKSLNQRAFQQVPPQLRRRTASHNVKRVPKRLRDRAKREMMEDNTPTVTARRRKPTGHMRLRLETARKLRMMATKTKTETATAADTNASARAKAGEVARDRHDATPVQPRAPKVKKAALARPPVPKAKFRKRQIHKSWLPTHLFHTKRAHMTAPSASLWRFRIPLSPTAKSYRATHRASHERGAVGWDTSYMSTIGLEGREDGVIGMLKAMGVSTDDLSATKGVKWRQGMRVLETFVHEREAPHELVAPLMVMWCAATPGDRSNAARGPRERKRKLLLRVHPSAFFQLWEEVLRLAKVAKPEVCVEDLRFEIGSIEVTGPGATEALLAALWPIPAPSDSPRAQPNGVDAHAAEGVAMDVDEPEQPSVEQTWSSLAGLNNTAMLPQNVLLGFNIQDPRLHHPPRTIPLPKSEAEQNQLLETIAGWPADAAQAPPQLFDRKARLAAGRDLPSEKAINRRKGLAPPGQYPEPSANDPKIPLILYTICSPTHLTDKGKRQAQQSSWTLLLPWKCVQPVWYNLMCYPLSTGQQPRFGGLNEVRQLAFEAGRPWFPADYPGTRAGWQWEAQERAKREDEWRRRPKGKRVCWEKVGLGGGREGEIGVGWACDWEWLLNGPRQDQAAKGSAEPGTGNDGASLHEAGASKDTTTIKDMPSAPKPSQLVQMLASQAIALISSADIPPPADLGTALVAVRLTLITRGVPQTCARIYRLPSTDRNPDLRKQWLGLLPSHQPLKKHGGSKNRLPILAKNAPPHAVQQRLAYSLLNPPRAGEDDYPACPPEQDLVGFVTTGNYNLAEGQGIGIGNVLLGRMIDEARKKGEESNLCIVRNAGNGVGRLARWNVV